MENKGLKHPESPLLGRPLDTVEKKGFFSPQPSGKGGAKVHFPHPGDFFFCNVTSSLLVLLNRVRVDNGNDD